MPWWDEGQAPPVTPTRVTGWWAELYAYMSMSVTPSVGMTSSGLVAASVNTSMGVTPALTMVGGGKSVGKFGLGVTPGIGMGGGGIAGTSSALFTLSVEPHIGMDSGKPFTLTVTPVIGMVGGEQYDRSFTVEVPPGVGMAGVEQYMRSVGLSVSPSLGMGGIGVSARDYAISVSPSLGMNGRGISARDYVVSVSPSVGMSAQIPPHSPTQVTVTGNGRTEVPWWARYIDVVLLGGGAAGKRGGVFSAGDGGKAGSYLTERWDRLAFPGVELGSLNIAIGGGGTGGDNGSGGNTQIWIDAYDKTTYSGETRIASGGSGTSGKREGASPGNKSFNGISAVGGGEDGGVPGAGGRGGSQNILGGNPGADGARGQAWLRFSQ